MLLLRGKGGRERGKERKRDRKKFTIIDALVIILEGGGIQI
jgi:hypothetical protein